MLSRTTESITKRRSSWVRTPPPEDPAHEDLRTLLESALSWSPHVRAAACAGLRKFRVEAAESALIRLAGDVDPSVCRAADRALRASGSEHLAELIARVLAGDESAVAKLRELVEQGEVRPFEAVTGHLDARAPQVRAAVRQSLDLVGPHAVERLLQRLRARDEGARVSASRALESVAVAMRALLPELLCPSCLTRFREREEVDGDVGAPLVVCRSCDHAVPHLRGVREVIAVLDRDAGACSVSDGVARCNALQHGRPFDFDRVEILDATDYDVERFCIEVGNDTDRVRRDRYPSMPCGVGDDCDLAPGTMRMLEQTFGQVTRAPLKGD